MPGFLIVVVDCLRADLLARPRDAWPAASAFAANGAHFSDAYTTCPTTTPAFTALFTGRPPTSHGVRALRGAKLSEDVPTFAEELGRAGWRTWASLTGPLLDNTGFTRGFGETEYRDVPDRPVHGEWGARFLERVRENAEGKQPWLGVVHLWDLHTPRKYPRSFEHRRYGRNAYERALAGIDPWLARLFETAGPDTTIVLTGDHGENTTLEPRTLRQQELAPPHPREAPGRGLGLALGRQGRALEVAPPAPDGAAPLLEPQPDALRARRPRADRRLRARDRARPAHDAGQPHRPRADAARPRRTAAAAGRIPRDEPRAGPARRRRAARASGRDGDADGRAKSNVQAVSQAAIRDGEWKLLTSLEDETVVDALYNLAGDPDEHHNLAGAAARRRRPPQGAPPEASSPSAPRPTR